MSALMLSSTIEPRARQRGDDTASLDCMANLISCCKEKEQHEEDAFTRDMNRRDYLRRLRLLALAEDRERQATIHEYDTGGSFCDEKKEDDGDGGASGDLLEDIVRILPGKHEKVLDYNSYLAHQRYYDDLKHADIKYIDFGHIHNHNHSSYGEYYGENRLVVEQRKHLGKGGWCWDAGFILGEHVIAHEQEWSTAGARPKVLELGAGTGLTGLMIAKATASAVTITDLPELAGLMQDNVQRNFSGHSDDAAQGSITTRVLRWGVPEDYVGAPNDVIIGADVVASLYDPAELARTLHALSGPRTKIYISSRERLDRPHREFDEAMGCLFERVEKIQRPSSRLWNPQVFIIVAEGKRTCVM